MFLKAMMGYKKPKTGFFKRGSRVFGMVKKTLMRLHSALSLAFEVKIFSETCKKIFQREKKFKWKQESSV